jgi:hypothetical protein
MLPGLLFIVLLVLKVLGYISISWWIVTAPIWGVWLLWTAFFALVAKLTLRD